MFSTVHATTQEATQLTVVWIEDLPDEEKEPLLSQSANVDALFTLELDPQTLLDVVAATAHHFADDPQAVLNQAVPTHLEDKVLVDVLAQKDAVEEGVHGKALHPTASLML